MMIQSWDDLTTISMFEKISRKSLSGENLTIARVELEKGGVVPGHSHPNEQVTLVVSGKLIFRGERDEETTCAGDIIHTPSGAFHEVTALEDSVVIDIFSPARSDWKE